MSSLRPQNKVSSREGAKDYNSVSLETIMKKGVELVRGECPPLHSGKGKGAGAVVLSREGGPPMARGLVSGGKRSRAS